MSRELHPNEYFFLFFFFFFFTSFLIFAAVHHRDWGRGRSLPETREMKRKRAYIPDEIIFDILLRLPVKSIIRFKSVCKSWSSLTSDPSFLQAHARRSTPAVIITEYRTTSDSPNFTLHPVLRSEDGSSGSRITIKAARILPLTLESVSFSLRASCDGLLCLRKVAPFSPPSCDYVCNSLTKEWFELPKSSLRCATICAFYYQPAMKEYRLLRHLLFAGDAGYQILTIGANEWRQIRCTFDGTPSHSLLSHVRKGPPPCCLEPPVSMHRKLHWFSMDSPATTDGLIMVFDINHEKFGQLSVPNICRGQTHVLELEGKLGLSVVASAMEMDLWILEDYEKEVWFKKYRINVQGIGGMPKGIRSKFFRPLVVSDAGEAVVSFYGDLVLYDLKRHTCFQIEGINDVLGDFYFLYKESFVRHDFFKMGHQDHVVFPTAAISS
ncbi:F-box protein [Cocos nucifera]|uniref:F-box protein n=1 Tax=Cocos nucifera TaxID=13894 RepID=A0A8K0N5Q4_COCNU|nr:F-box protein [Cocos nucifera]